MPDDEFVDALVRTATWVELQLYPIGWPGYPIELGFGVPGATPDPTRRGFCFQILRGLKARQRLVNRRALMAQ
jgi:hypothetical protein